MQNLTMTISTLPPFRVIGLSRTAQLLDMADVLEQLFQEWQHHPIQQQPWGFSRNLYCLKHSIEPDTGQCQVLLGRLCSNDAELPHPECSAYFVYPQQFTVEKLDTIPNAAQLASYFNQSTAANDNPQLCDFIVLPTTQQNTQWYRSIAPVSLDNIPSII